MSLRRSIQKRSCTVTSTAHIGKGRNCSVAESEGLAWLCPQRQTVIGQTGFGVRSSLSFTKKLYARILSYNFKDTDTADGVLSGLARFKMVIYPFVSRQKAFGYSDITEGNMKHLDLIVPHFERADVRLKQIHAVSHIYNYPWDNDQVGLAPSDNK